MDMWHYWQNLWPRDDGICWSRVKLHNDACSESDQAGCRQSQGSSTADCWSPSASIDSVLHRRWPHAATSSTTRWGIDIQHCTLVALGNSSDKHECHTGMINCRSGLCPLSTAWNIASYIICCTFISGCEWRSSSRMEMWKIKVYS